MTGILLVDIVLIGAIVWCVFGATFLVVQLLK
jgi:hypothetical protein